MNLSVLVKLILILLLVFIIIYTIKLNKSLKLSSRINKYTIKNQDKSVSIGDYFYSVYLKVKNILINILSKSVYFKNKSKKFNKYAYKDNSGISIIATKFCIFYIAYFKIVLI